MVLATKGAVVILDSAARRQFQRECCIDNPVKFFQTRARHIWVRVYAKDLVEAIQLYDSRKQVFAAKCWEWALGKLHIFWSREEKGIAIRPSSPGSQSGANFNMVQNQPTENIIQTPEQFVWFGGIINPSLKPFLDRMENSDEPTGLVQPTLNDEGVIKTIQWGINRASVDLFGFNALSMEDMRSAIQRDTSGDWFGPDLEEKRRLYQQADTRFEQTARIKTKAGWIKVHFQCERIGVGNLVLSRGRQVSEMAERPELLTLV